jgi:hypothetical protein
MGAFLFNEKNNMEGDYEIIKHTPIIRPAKYKNKNDL